MFELFRNQSRSAAGAIKYVTIGTLLIIWAGLWYYYFLMPAPNAPTWQKFTCVGSAGEIGTPNVTADPVTTTAVNLV